MSTEVRIDQMTLEEKLRFMEALWDDLRSKPEDLPLPQWHKDVLDEREKLIEKGEAKFSDWKSAKKRITDEIS